jgi:O-antigen ligase
MKRSIPLPVICRARTCRLATAYVCAITLSLAASWSAFAQSDSQRIENQGAPQLRREEPNALVNAAHDASGLVIVHTFNGVFASLTLLIPSLHRCGENAAAIGLATLVLLGTLAIVWLLGTASHLQIYFTLIGALLLFVGTQNWKLVLLYFVLFTAALLFALNYAPHDGLIMPQDTGLRDMLTNQAIINTITVNSVIHSDESRRIAALPRNEKGTPIQVGLRRRAIDSGRKIDGVSPNI